LLDDIPFEREDFMRNQRLTLTDLCTCIVMLALLSTTFLAARHLVDESQSRKQCASNMRQIGQACLLYANENKGAYPRTIYKPADAKKPTWGTPYEKSKDLGASEKADPFCADDNAEAIKYRPAANDVSSAFFLLMRTQDIISDVFICPSTNREKFDFGGGANTALSWTNWPGNNGLAEHLSYSYQNPYPSQAAIDKGFKLNFAIPANFAIASDMNPGGNALTKIATDTPLEQQADGNSRNHQGDGQNVLYADGHVTFQTTPLCGMKDENIFTYGDSGTDSPKKGGDGVVGPPAGPDDSILLPTAQDIGAGKADPAK
jgi:prepilin-type processing-associated H-X9-DG protein